LVLAFALGLCCGAGIALLALSSGCRAAVLVVLRLVAGALQGPAAAGGGARLQQRLAEYRAH
jgi:hypothetical protein